MSKKNCRPNIISTELIKSKIRASGLKKERVHVISQNGGWAVKKEAARRASGVFQDKSDAINRAKSLITKDSSKTILVIHSRSGKVESYEKDPIQLPPKK